MLKPIIGGYGMPNFMEKTFVAGSKTVKFVNIFSLESFALYGNVFFFYEQMEDLMLMNGVE